MDKTSSGTLKSIILGAVMLGVFAMGRISEDREPWSRNSPTRGDRKDMGAGMLRGEESVSFFI